MRPYPSTAPRPLRTLSRHAFEHAAKRHEHPWCSPCNLCNRRKCDDMGNSCHLGVSTRASRSRHRPAAAAASMRGPQVPSRGLIKRWMDPDTAASTCATRVRCPQSTCIRRACVDWLRCNVRCERFLQDVLGDITLAFASLSRSLSTSVLSHQCLLHAPVYHQLAADSRRGRGDVAGELASGSGLGG